MFFRDFCSLTTFQRRAGDLTSGNSLGKGNFEQRGKRRRKRTQSQVPFKSTNRHSVAMSTISIAKDGISIALFIYKQQGYRKGNLCY